MNTKHTPGKLEVAGCALYQEDNWKDGNNRGGLQIGTTAIQDEDECPSDTLIDLAILLLLIGWFLCDRYNVYFRKD